MTSTLVVLNGGERAVSPQAPPWLHLIPAELRRSVANIPAPRDAALDLAPPTALSLNIAQSCNLSCSYCYAYEGRFGSKPQFMPLEVALAAIERALAGAGGQRVTIGF